jgi:RHS repeat-associated protein
MQEYRYDALNRLVSTGEGSNWSRTFNYDAVGNMWAGGGGQALDSFTPQSADWISASNNRLVNPGMNIGYDGAGNLTSIGAFGWTYDAESRLSTSVVGGATTSYGYDGEGRRVTKATGNSTTVYVYDGQGQLAAEYATQASQSPCGATCYMTADHLGSTRMLTDAAGNVVSLHDYLPFGEEIEAGTGARSNAYYPPDPLAINDGTTEKFTGKERDQETGLDYFGARYLSAAQGRWTIPDWSESPEPVPYADLANPQTLNLYAHARNNPLARTDPDGHCTVDGENHGWLWCAAHTIGLVQTQQEQANTARQALAQMHGFTIGGQTPGAIAKNGNNQQVIAAYHSASQFLLGVGQESLNELMCPKGMQCGVIPIGPPGELGAVEGGLRRRPPEQRKASSPRTGRGSLVLRLTASTERSGTPRSAQAPDPKPYLTQSGIPRRSLAEWINKGGRSRYTQARTLVSSSIRKLATWFP